MRVLCFGGDLGAVDEIADRLAHPHAAVSRAAREGLLALGDRAIPALERARARARPDRRARIDAVLAEIRARQPAATGE
ncbi:hypothetical protein WMF31_35665 [Sorangium sp. So ce1036]|uniref:hypothetical protein n=1 Tax=Sorangium sp. So ce1036 TaxID=3133328 RepID=UPI003F007F57